MHQMASKSGEIVNTTRVNKKHINTINFPKAK